MVGLWGALGLGKWRQRRPRGIVLSLDRAGPGGDRVSGQERVGMIAPQGLLDSGSPAQPAPEVLGRTPGVSQREDFHQAIVLTDRPEMLGLPSRGVPVEGVAGIMRFGGSELGDGFGQGAARLP